MEIVNQDFELFYYYAFKHKLYIPSITLTTAKNV